MESSTPGAAQGVQPAFPLFRGLDGQQLLDQFEVGPALLFLGRELAGIELRGLAGGLSDCWCGRQQLQLGRGRTGGSGLDDPGILVPDHLRGYPMLLGILAGELLGLVAVVEVLYLGQGVYSYELTLILARWEWLLLPGCSLWILHL